MYELTLFKNQFDNKTHRRTTFFNWLDFVVCLRDSTQREKKVDLIVLLFLLLLCSTWVRRVVTSLFFIGVLGVALTWMTLLTVAVILSP